MTDLVALLWYSSGTSLLFSPESYIKLIKHKSLSPLELWLLMFALRCLISSPVVYNS